MKKGPTREEMKRFLNFQTGRTFTSFNKGWKVPDFKVLKELGIVEDLKELYTEMEKRRYNMRRIGLFATAFVCYLFYDHLKNWISVEASDVTSKYLKNENFKRELLVFVEQTIEELAKSERVKRDVSSLLKEVVKDEQTQRDLSEMFVKIFESQTIKTAGSQLSSEVVKDLFYSTNHESFRNELVSFVVDQLQRVANDSELQQTVGVASWNAFKTWFGSTSNNREQKEIDVSLTNDKQ